MKLPSSCIHPEVVSNLYAFLSSAEHNEDILKNVGSQTVSDPIDAVGTNTFLVTHILQNILFYVQQKKK